MSDNVNNTNEGNNEKKTAALNPKTLEPRILLSATAIEAEGVDEEVDVELDQVLDSIVEDGLGESEDNLFDDGNPEGEGGPGEDSSEVGVTTGEGRYADVDEDIDDITVDEEGRTRLYSVNRGLVMDLEKGIELPNNYSVEFDVEAASTEKGSNFFYIFDYVNKRNFKYAGARAEADDWVIGERVDGKWNDLAKVPVDSIDEDSPSSIEIKVMKGREVCLFEDGELQVVHEFDEKIQSDVFGLANRNADSFFENVTIIDGSDEVIYGDGAPEDPFADIPSISEVDGRTRLFSDGRGLVVDIDESLDVSDSYTVDFDFEAASGHKGANVFYIFDYVDEKNFKYAGSRTQCDDWVIGERSEGRWTDFAHLKVDDVPEDQLLNLTVEIQGGEVCLSSDGGIELGYDFGDSFASEVAGFGNRHAETFISDVSVTQGTSKNQGPDAQDDKILTDYNASVSGNVLTNDVDPDNDTLTVSLDQGPANGTVVLNDDGTYEYTPNDGFSGTDTFTYTVDDGNGGTDTAEVSIEVGEKPNEGPDAENDKVQTDYNTIVGGNVLDNDSDPEGDNLTVALQDAPANGNVTLNADGSYEYAPNDGFSGTDTFTYTVDDGNGGTDTAEVCIEVGEKPNEGPTADDDKNDTPFETAVGGNVLDNDSDPDGDNLTVTLVTPPEFGTLTLNADGSYEYTPEAGFSGEDTFEYQVDDGRGGTDTAEVCITVGEKPNEGPNAENDEFQTEFESPVEGTVLDNDSDPDGDNLTVSLVADPGSGSVTLNPDGSFEYTPDPGFSGIDTFEYQIDDGNGGTDIAEVTITVTPKPNEGPDAVKDTAETAYETAVGGNVLDNDSDPDGDNLTVTLAQGPANGTVVLNADGTYEYTPNEGFSGEDTFTYTVDDGKGGTDTAEVCIEVGEKPNEGPTAEDDKFQTEFGAPVGGNILDNDADPDGDNLTVTLVTAPSQGTIVLNDDGSFVYTPPAGFSGTDTFEYQIDDGNGGIDTAEVCIEVADKPNEGPAAENDKVQTEFNSPATGNVLDNDTDPDGDNLTVTLKDGPANGTVVLNADGSYEYTPNDGFSGTDTFTYTVDDGNGGTDTAEVCIEVAEEPNEDPDAVDDKFDTDKPQSEKVFSYDRIDPPGSDNGGDIKRVTTSFNETTNEFDFRMVVDGDTNGFTLAINDGPNPKGNGDEMALFYFDNTGSDPVVTAYNYNGQNNFSSFQDTPLVSSLNADSPFTGIEVTTDPAGNKVFSFRMDATSIQEHSDGTNWTGVAFDEKIGMWLHPMEGLETTYGADGYLDSWNFDSQGWFDTADQAAQCEVIDGEASVSGNVLTNDADADGDDLTVSAVNGETGSVGADVAGSNGGTFTIGADGSMQFEAGGDFDDLKSGETRVTSVTYTIDDGEGGTDTATVKVCVAGDPDTEPVVVKDQRRIVNSAYNNGHGREVILDLSQSVMDADGDDLTYKLNFADSFFVDGQDDERGGADAPGKFGWKVKSFDADTGKLVLQVYTEQGEAWHYDGHQAASDVFVKAPEPKAGADWSSGQAYQPFSFSVCDEDGNEIDTTFGLQVFDVDYNSPIALDLNSDGEIGVTGEHTARDSYRSEVGETVAFDIDGDGDLDQIEWTDGEGDGMLVDTSKIGPDGQIDGTALFGDEGGRFDHGYEKLSALDTDGDGQISGDEADDLAVWVDDGDAILEEGELQSLADHDIASISTEMEMDGEGRMRSTATTTDGEEIMTEDVWFAGDDADRKAQLEQLDETRQQIQDRMTRLRDRLLGDQ